MQAMLVLSADAKGIIPVFDQEPFQRVQAEVDDDDDLSENEEVSELETGGFLWSMKKKNPVEENSEMKSDQNDLSDLKITVISYTRVLMFF